MTPLPRNEANEILNKIELRHGGSRIEPTVDSDYSFIDVFSGKLPIYYKKEFNTAEKIGEKYSLRLIWHDFSLGEGELTKHEPVYVSTCKSPDELRKAPETISLAVAELKKEIKS